MNSNVSVLTDNAKAVVLATSDGYQANVLAHVNGDYGAHNSLRVQSTPFLENGSTITTAISLRLGLTDWLSTNPVAVAVLVPVIAGTNAVFGGGPPVILSNPVGETVAVGDTAEFDIVVASQAPPSYVWDNGTVVVNGDTASLILTGVTTTDAGTYFCTVSNSFGSVVSTGAALVVTSTPGGGGVGASPIFILQTPSNGKLHVGTAITTFVYVDTSSATPVSFQWQQNAANIAPSATLTPQTWTGHPNGSILRITGKTGIALHDKFRVIASNVNGSSFSIEWEVTAVTA